MFMLLVYDVCSMLLVYDVWSMIYVHVHVVGV